jgi:hypothetical protein
MMGFPITNNSWGGGGFSQALFDAISAANDNGYLFIAAAGNSSVDTDFSPFYPSFYNLPNVISVAATDHNDNLSSFSNYGLNSVDLGAPGSSIYSTVPTGICDLCKVTGYNTLNGTSMATPHVSGAAALLWEFDPSLTHLEVKDKIMNLAEPIDSLQGKTVTGSRLNIYNFFENDTFPPANIFDLSAVDRTYRSVTLGWTSVGDDLLEGTASRYDLRYSENPINATNFDLANEVIGEPMPSPSGTAETFKVTGLQQNTTYYFALKVFDNVGNGTLNLVSGTTLMATVIFFDDMENGENGWTVDGTGGIPPDTSLWHQSQRRAVSPANSWYYGREDTGNYDTGIINQGSITSPDIDLSSLVESELTFQHFLSKENAPWDIGRVQISNDGGFTWTTVLEGISTAGKWINESVDLSAYDGSTIKVQFHFETRDQWFNHYEGWYIDDVIVQGTYIGTNTKPVANAGPDQTIFVDNTANLDGSGSSDADGDTLTYQWSLTSVPAGSAATLSNSTTASPSFIADLHGTYVAQLIVNDNIVDSDPDTAEVNVLSITDTVNITKAEYRTTKSILTVEATSSEGGTAELTLEGHGVMVYNSRKDKYKLTVNVVTTTPDSVTVNSSKGGVDTATVTERAGGSKKKK